MQFWAILGRFGPFWAVLGHFMSQIRQNLFLENKNVRFWDIKHFVAPPENGKTFFRKIRMCDFGTSDTPNRLCCTPPENGKTFKLKIRIVQKWTYTFLYLFCWSLTDVPFLAKHFLIKKESTKNGHQMH